MGTNYRNGAALVIAASIGASNGRTTDGRIIGRSEWAALSRLARVTESVREAETEADLATAREREIAATRECAAMGLPTLALKLPERPQRVSTGLVDHRPTFDPSKVSAESALVADDKRHAWEAADAKESGIATPARSYNSGVKVGSDDFAIECARASVAKRLRKASAGRSADYGRRLCQRDNVADGIGGTLDYAAQYGRRWHAALIDPDIPEWERGGIIPAGIATATLDALAAWVVGLPFDAAAFRTGIAWAAARVVRGIAPESGVKAKNGKGRVPSGWRRVVAGIPGNGTTEYAVAYDYLRRGDDGIIESVTEWADPDARLKYVGRTEYVRQSPSASGTQWDAALWSLAASVDPESASFDPAIRTAVLALIETDGIGALFGRIRESVGHEESAETVAISATE